VKHQREVGTGYFDAVTTTIEANASTAALKGSTEDEQFFDASGSAGPRAVGPLFQTSLSSLGKAIPCFIRRSSAPRWRLRSAA
jgi:hypothetical protein